MDKEFVIKLSYGVRVPKHLCMKCEGPVRVAFQNQGRGNDKKKESSQ